MTNEHNTWIWADWPAPDHIRAGTTTRRGGYSRSPFDELNLAQHVGDSINTVNKNRKKISKQLSLKSAPLWLNQYHSNQIIPADTYSKNQNADAIMASKTNTVCTIMTADCVPILICDKQGEKIAAVHAGWRGISSGIIEKTIKQFSEPENVLVWLGPCISQEFYEVGEDVFLACIHHETKLSSTFIQKDDQHWHYDLPESVKIILKNSGIGAIYECGLCTYRQSDLFYSYRRDGKTGRTAAMIWME